MSDPTPTLDPLDPFAKDPASDAALSSPAPVPPDPLALRASLEPFFDPCLPEDARQKAVDYALELHAQPRELLYVLLATTHMMIADIAKRMKKPGAPNHLILPRHYRNGRR